MTTDQRFILHTLLATLHEANHDYICSLTAVVEHLADPTSLVDSRLQLRLSKDA